MDILNKRIKYILENTSERVMLEQLAEEASELTWAALKLIRAKGYSDNPTNIEPKVAARIVEEEMRDVILLITLAGMRLGLSLPDEGIDEIIEGKIERWSRRLGYERDK